MNLVAHPSALSGQVQAPASKSHMQRLLAAGSLHPGTMKNVLVHMIADDDLMAQLSVATKTVPNAAVIAKLKQAGQTAAERFLTDHKGKIGKESSVNLRQMFA